MNEIGLKNGLKDATKGGIIGPPEKTIFYIPGTFPIFRPSQDHTSMKITFKDGTVFYIDCGTISSGDINTLGAEIRFSIPGQIPKNWKIYPFEKPDPPVSEEMRQRIRGWRWPY